MGRASRLQLPSLQPGCFVPMSVQEALTIAVTLSCDSVRTSNGCVNASVLTRSFGRQMHPAVSQMLSHSLLLAMCYLLVASLAAAAVSFPAAFVASMGKVVKKHETGLCKYERFRLGFV